MKPCDLYLKLTDSGPCLIDGVDQQSQRCHRTESGGCASATEPRPSTVSQVCGEVFTHLYTPTGTSPVERERPCSSRGFIHGRERDVLKLVGACGMSMDERSTMEVVVTEREARRLIRRRALCTWHFRESVVEARLNTNRRDS